jgi:hypothetical protein
MTCVHHWVIPSPRGRPQETGKCKKCGAEKLFAISLAAATVSKKLPVLGTNRINWYTIGHR